MSSIQNIPGQKVAIIAYFTMLGAIIAISMNNNNPTFYSRFHTRQAFGTHLVFHAFALFLSQWFNEFALLGLYTMYLLLWGYGFWSALHGTKNKLPIVGHHFQKWFTFIK